MRGSILYNVLTVFVLFSAKASAQNNEVLSTHVASLQVTYGDNWQDPPVGMLGSETPMVIGFDDMMHEYHRYAYKIEHCDADWQPSNGLFVSDFAQGVVDGNIIKDVAESEGMNQLYTHYSLQIPNEEVRLTLSGNYRVTVYDDNSGEEILRAYFMLCEPLMGMTMSMTTNTDIDINHSHQQLSAKLNYGQLKVSRPEEQIRTVFLQNWRWDNARHNVRPQYSTTDGLQWNHARDLIFDGGNEYRKFELLDVMHPTMGVEHTYWDGHDYHAYLWRSEPRPSYDYEADANGAFYIRNMDNAYNDIASEYILVHFTLKAPRQDGDVYISGRWTNGELSDKYLLTYDEQNQEYTATVKLKQGYYSYQYLVLKADGTTAPVTTEGNFFQTENSYQALVYYRPDGARTDRLVAYSGILVAAYGR